MAILLEADDEPLVSADDLNPRLVKEVEGGRRDSGAAVGEEQPELPVHVADEEACVGVGAASLGEVEVLRANACAGALGEGS